LAWGQFSCVNRNATAFIAEALPAIPDQIGALMNKAGISTIDKASLAIESGVITNEESPIAIEVRAFWIANGAKGVEKGQARLRMRQRRLRMG